MYLYENGVFFIILPIVLLLYCSILMCPCISKPESGITKDEAFCNYDLSSSRSYILLHKFYLEVQSSLLIEDILEICFSNPTHPFIIIFKKLKILKNLHFRLYSILCQIAWILYMICKLYIMFNSLFTKITLKNEKIRISNKILN